MLGLIVKEGDDIRVGRQAAHGLIEDGPRHALRARIRPQAQDEAIQGVGTQAHYGRHGRGNRSRGMGQTLGIERRVTRGSKQRACGYRGAKDPADWKRRQVHRAATLRNASRTVSEGQQSIGMRLAFW